MKLKLTLLASAIALANSASSFAQDGAYKLEEVVVVGSLAEKTQQERTRSIAILDSSQLDQMQLNSVAEAVKYEPNLTTVGANVPGNQSINIRGLGENKIVQIIDGTRQNIAYGHRPTYFLDPSLLGELQVVKGPMSSLYGSGAIGGVVIQNTLNASDIANDQGLGVRVKTGYQDNGDVWTNTAALASQTAEFDWLIAGSHKDAGFMEQGDGTTLYGTEATNKTGLAKFNWYVDDAHRLGLNLRYADLDGRPPVVGDSSGQLNDKDKLISRQVKDSSLALNYGFNPGNDLVDFEALLYRNGSEITEKDPNQSGEDLSEITTTGINLNNQSVFGTLELLTGFDGYQDKFDATRATSTAGRPELPKGAKTVNYGAFSYVNYEVFTRLVLDAGIRYDSFESKADGFQNHDKDAWSPSVGLLWQAQPWMAWSIRYDEAFRAPGTAELYMSGTHFGRGAATNDFIPNPDLKPEKSHNTELKGQFDFANLIAEDKLQITAAVFRNKVEDLISLDVDMNSNADIMACFMSGGSSCLGTSTSKNISNAELEGYEVATNYLWQDLDLGLSYGQTRGKDVNSGEHLANIPADKWVASAEYFFLDFNTTIGTKATLIDNQDRVPNDQSDDKFGSYELVDFYVTWEPGSELDGLKVDFAVVNAFDENYRQAWNEVYQPGRSVRLAAQYTF